MRMNKEQQDLVAINDDWASRVPSEDDLPISELDDLAVEDDAAVKGGSAALHLKPLTPGILNHNETTASDDDDEVQLPDLPVDEQADEVLGGTGVWHAANHDPGFKWNHNETIVSDQEDEVPLADLPVIDEQADEVSGGPVTFPSKGGGMWIGN